MLVCLYLCLCQSVCVYMCACVDFSQVLTLENYQQTMYSVVRASNWASTLWFTWWIFFGKYTFLALFLTVTLEAFDNK